MTVKLKSENIIEVNGIELEILEGCGFREWWVRDCRNSICYKIRWLEDLEKLVTLLKDEEFVKAMDMLEYCSHKTVDKYKEYIKENINKLLDVKERKKFIEKIKKAIKKSEATKERIERDEDELLEMLYLENWDGFLRTSSKEYYIKVTPFGLVLLIYEKKWYGNYIDMKIIDIYNNVCYSYETSINNVMCRKRVLKLLRLIKNKDYVNLMREAKKLVRYDDVKEELDIVLHIMKDEEFKVINKGNVNKIKVYAVV